MLKTLLHDLFLNHRPVRKAVFFFFHIWIYHFCILSPVLPSFSQFSSTKSLRAFLWGTQRAHWMFISWFTAKIWAQRNKNQFHFFQFWPSPGLYPRSSFSRPSRTHYFQIQYAQTLFLLINIAEPFLLIGCIFSDSADPCVTPPFYYWTKLFHAVFKED